MKYSYKVLKNYLPFLTSGQQVATDIIMHTAEVEGVHMEGENLKDVYVGQVLECHKHPDSEKLNICKVSILGEEKQIVCGAPNVKIGIKVPVAIVGAKLREDFTIEKCKIRGETSEGMICSEDELGLVTERQAGILILDDDAKMGMSMREYLGKSDEIIEIDNKGINHRPDMFSYIGLARELAVINGKKVEFDYEKNDFTPFRHSSEGGNLSNEFHIKNEIPEMVKRYIGLKLSGVSNIESPDEIKSVVKASGNNPKGLLVDISNYCLYLYGQPTHCFDADKINGDIIIRFAKNDEEFIALDSKTYKLTSEDIVIADKEKVLALGGVIGGSLSAVSDTTKNIVVEGAQFNAKNVRKTGRKHGIRTDSLNVFEKDIPSDLALYGVSLIYRKLKEIFQNLKIEGYNDVYPIKQEIVKAPFDLTFINNLIGAKYTEKEAIEVLENLGLKLEGDKLTVPFWRKDLHYKADIAEEVARIKGFDKIETTIPRINLGAIIQDNIYKLKNDIRDFFVDRGYFDMYNYSFVNEELMTKLLGDVSDLVPLKNSLSEDMTHMKGSLIPNLITSIEKNIRQKPNLKLFEFEKVFNICNSHDSLCHSNDSLSNSHNSSHHSHNSSHHSHNSSRHSCEGRNLSNGQNTIIENYNFAGVITSTKETVYYDLQKVISDLFKKIQIDNYMFSTPKNYPTFVHKGRTASIIVRGQEVGFVGEIHPSVANNFSLETRIGFFEINADKLKSIVYNKVKASEVSAFQENNFDLSFVVPKEKAGKDIQISIAKTDPKIIQKVELFDIYENEEKLPGKRSLSFKIYIQSLDGTLGDEVKNNLIKSIIERVGKIGGVLR